MFFIYILSNYAGVRFHTSDLIIYLHVVQEHRSERMPNSGHEFFFERCGASHSAGFGLTFLSPHGDGMGAEPAAEPRQNAGGLGVHNVFT